MVHFANLKSDMPGEIRRIAEFIGTPIDESKLERILKHCSFDYMQANATKSVPLGGAFWDGGAQTFIHKGQNGRWRDVLSAEQNMQYEQRAQSELGPTVPIGLPRVSSDNMFSGCRQISYDEFFLVTSGALPVFVIANKNGRWRKLKGLDFFNLR